MTASGAAINISHITVVSVALLLGMVNDASAQKSPNIPVTVAFVDGTTDNIRSDGLGAYKDGINGVVAYIAVQSFGGILVFASNTSGTGGRQLQFHFGDCLLDCTAFPFLAGSAVAQVQVGPKNPDGSAVAKGLMGIRSTARWPKNAVWVMSHSF